MGGAWWFQCGIKVGLCAGRVGAMPLLVLRHGKQGVKTWVDGITEVAAQRLQLKTVIITLLGEMESKKCVCVCARVCGTVWCVVSGLRGVLIGPLIVWNRTNKCVRFFSWRGCRGAGAWLFSRFSSSQKMHLIWGSRCYLSVFHWGR